MSRVNLFLMAAFLLSGLVGMAYGDPPIDMMKVFGLPLLLSSLSFVPYLFKDDKPVNKRTGYKLLIASFLYMVIIGSIPFLLSGGMDPIEALFESMAGFTTTGLSGMTPEGYEDLGMGLLFYRSLIQWIGGLFYLLVAFMVISEIMDIGKRNLDLDMFSRLGLRMDLSNLLFNLSAIYLVFTVVALGLFRLSGMDLFDSVTLSLGTVSTGGFHSGGARIDAGVGMKLLVVPFMILAGVGYQVHMSVFSARSRSRMLFSMENVTYFLLCLSVPVILFMILVFSGYSPGSSLWKGIFVSISALTTTGFMVSGMEEWPESAKFFLLVLMLIGGSSLSVASGFKVRRVYMLATGFVSDMKRSAHPRAVLPVRTEWGAYSERALESAIVVFFYFFLALFLSVGFTLLFEGDILSSISLCVTAITNSGIAFGGFSEVSGIAGINDLLKFMLVLVMFLGRFEVLLPLYLFSPRSYTFNG